MTAAGLAGAPAPTRGLTLADHLVPERLRERASALQRDALLVLAGTGLLIAGAYASFTVPALQLGTLYVPVNPYVPLTLQTFAVLFTGALLGAGRGVSATGLYLLIGIVGVPVFSADAEGVHRRGLETFASLEGGQLVLGSTGGYLVGFLLASAVVGRLAERGWDRRLRGSLAAMVLGSLVIYAAGLAWLAVAHPWPGSVDETFGGALPATLTFGLYPFLPGDIAKLLVAAGLLPLGWRLVSRRASELPGGPPGPA
jgi:biotin transporter BioY